MKISHRWLRVILATGGGVALMAAATACSSVQPSVGQYAIVTGHGNLSNQQVLGVVDPGQQVKFGSGTTTWYVPANIRNYVTAQSNGDRGQPQSEITGSTASSPGMPDYTYTYVTWELNPNHKVLAAFLPFCLKYGCASKTPQNDSSNAALTRSSSPGWNAMLTEIFPRAIDNATRDAIQSFGPNLWTNRPEWGTYGSKITAALPGEMSKLTGSTTPYFCGPGSTATHCAPISVIVSTVDPVDSGVKAAYNQQVSSAYAAQAGAERLKAAQEVYGKWANYFLGLQDTVTKCAATSHCWLNMGAPPQNP